ncbi:MAG: taurine catabolism dioxygenase TauD [Thiobacillus sp. 63-78]|uniref:TauD/TfdA family dioxygenase n=1 Tax=Thiobacillus sp. 63-78 TaxID=1895859 RepID=UPI00086F02B5|nr:TauD/TfdA family dioxygenase [Thiobacillus sp. 63-78]MBN8774256.1 TauD/TfdA family dioxygenase [Thiobacillus sp.]ODV12859.1 MAG: taurine catabolism dioxygenase TauD [Thiobacillus sp. SCN 64-317]OJZ14983.1 MAG: taurine catabolism dioxygenase TauD [Thiobacillus sp. 63-78]
MANSPFDLTSETGYRAWRTAKLAAYPRSVDELIVPLADPRQLSAAETVAIESCCARANMAIYRSSHLPAADKSIPRQLSLQLGLVRLEGNYLADEDGLSSITPASDEHGVRGEFIPYTHKPINWHTDGYYNALDRRILGMTLHCVQDAESGGENALLDHEIAYLQLRDVNPDYVAALMQADAMTIPARMDEGNVARPAQSGPVFAVDPVQGFLTMRYTARTRSIVWKDDAITQAAVRTLADILASSEYILNARLQPGMGLLCNNVLHTRSGFSDSPGRRRLLYRGRYYDRLRFDLNSAPARPQ